MILVYHVIGFVLLLVLILSICQLFNVLNSIKYFLHTRTERKSRKNYEDLVEKITTFLVENKGKYNKESLAFLEIVGNFKGIDYSSKEYIKVLDKKTERLLDLFKNIIPELIQEERNKKLKILVGNKKHRIFVLN